MSNLGSPQCFIVKGCHKEQCSLGHGESSERLCWLKKTRDQLSLWSEGSDTQGSICQLPRNNSLLVDPDLVTIRNKWKIIRASVFLFNSWESYPRFKKWSPRDVSVHVGWEERVCGSCSHSVCHSSVIQQLRAFSDFSHLFSYFL